MERWKDSDLSAADFAKELGINPRTLIYWKWRFGSEARKKARRPAKATVQFLELTPAQIAPATTAAPVVPASVLAPTAPLEVVVRNALRIRVPADFDAGTLRRLVSALEQA